MAYSLTPVWITPANHLISVVETDDISFTLLAREELVLSGKAGDQVIELTDGASRVETVLVNGSPVGFSVNDDAIVISPLVADAPITLRTHSANFRILNGLLPPGLNLSPAGVISGRTGNLVGQSRSYCFTARIWNESYVRDRSFNIDITGFDFAGHINPKSIKGGFADPTLGIVYHPLTTLKRGSPYRLTFDVLDPDGVAPPLRAKMVTALPDEEGIHGWLPPGLVIEGSELLGRIDAEAPAGAYYFTIVVDDPVEASQTTFRIIVEDDVDTKIVASTEMFWLTPPGNIGTLKEAHRSLLGVECDVIGGVDATYSLTLGSGSLPPGLTLKSNGDISGVVGPVSGNATYTFTVRATSGKCFIERTFSIFVTTFFNAVPYYDMKLRLNVTDRLNFMRPYKASIPASSVYKSDDVLVGIPAVPEAYLIRGLDARVPLESIRSGRDSDAEDTDGYFQPIDLILGEHRVAVDRDPNGNVLCEVIYRVLYDHQELAGGFRFHPSTLTSELVISPINGRTIYPSSLRNQRLEMVSRMGFATLDPAKKYTLGVDGLEVLPSWMRCEQIVGNPGSVLGFIPAIVIAYVKPGTAKDVVKLVRANPYVPKTGKVFSFDRYYVTGGNTDHVQL